jgi:predicted nucleic acid-binding protein
VARTAYLDTSIFVEMGTKGSKHKKRIRELLKELSDDKVRLYTSILTVQELSVAIYRSGTTARDTYGDISSIARICTMTKDVALTAAKREAELKDLAEKQTAKRSKRRPETDDEKLERICENRRRKWDCFHIATAQLIGCPEFYTTDKNLQKRPHQLGIRSLKALTPDAPIKTIRGPLLENVDPIKDIT